MPIVDHNARVLEQVADLVIRLREVVDLIECVFSAAPYGRSPGRNVSPSCSAVASKQPPQPSDHDSPLPPIADRTTFSAHWGGKTCRLGNTICFRLLERLARRPNQLVSYDVLLQEVWEGRRSREAVRSAVKVLRQKLILAGLKHLAQAIDGSISHHYRLALKGRL